MLPMGEAGSGAVLMSSTVRLRTPAETVRQGTERSQIEIATPQECKVSSDSESSLEIEISVVSPVYQAESCVEELYRRLTATLTPLTAAYEIILVEDCSHDQSWSRITAIAARDAKVRGLQLSRNFGQQLAIAAGLAASRGKIVVVMDCDLQDPPEKIPQLIEEARRGFDIVYTRRLQRTATPFKRLTSRLFFFVMNTISPWFADPGQGSFSVISRTVVNEYLRVVDVHSHYLSILGWLGFRTTRVDVEQEPRFAGQSSYSLGKLISHALNGIASQSTRLLHISTAVGLCFALVACVQIVYLVYRKLFLSIGVEGWASLMVVLWFVGGTILFSLGVIGLYLGRMFEHTRQRPLFIVRERTDGET
ncbi:MAG: glycosyltransferase family 2 protein [Candidatus Binatia bacterium]